MSQRFLRLMILAIVIGTHALACLQFQTKSIPNVILPEWEGQFYFLLTISVLLGCLLPLTKKTVNKWLVLLLRSIIILVVGLPLGNFLGIEQTLLFPLIIEAVEYTSILDGIIFVLSLTGVIIGIHLSPIVAWGHLLPNATGQDLWSFGITALLTLILSILMHHQRKNQVPVMEINRLFHEATLQLAEVNMQLQEYATTVEQEAVINERKRLARDLHDILAYTLTNLIMMLEEAKDLAVKEETGLLEHLDHTCEQTKEGLAELRRALQALRPINLTMATGLTAIHQLIATFNKATQIEVELNLGNAPLNFGEEVDLVAYRLVQEGITNALRHGRADKISVSIRLINGGVSIHIKDNGIGAGNPQEGYGLLGMRERIERLGGKLVVSSQLGEGFRLLAWIPLPKGEQDG